jgi:hypothetical protein
MLASLEDPPQELAELRPSCSPTTSGGAPTGSTEGRNLRTLVGGAARQRGRASSRNGLGLGDSPPTPTTRYGADPWSDCCASCSQTTSGSNAKRSIRESPVPSGARVRAGARQYVTKRARDVASGVGAGSHAVRAGRARGDTRHRRRKQRSSAQEDLNRGSPKFSIRELSVDLSANSLSADANADGDDRGTAIAGCVRFGHSPRRRS